jgi:hypothetical protein
VHRLLSFGMGKRCVDRLVMGRKLRFTLPTLYAIHSSPPTGK